MEASAGTATKLSSWLMITTPSTLTRTLSFTTTVKVTASEKGTVTYPPQDTLT